MAKIHVTTDDGELLNTWSDAGLGDDEIGDLSRGMNRQRVIDEIESAVGQARQREGRDERGSSASDDE